MTYDNPTYNAAVEARKAYEDGVKVNNEKRDVEVEKMTEVKLAGLKAVDDLHQIARDQVSQQATKDERAIRDAHAAEETRLRDAYNQALRNAAEQQASEVLSGSTDEG